MDKKEVDVQAELLRLLDYYKETLENGGCTIGAMESFYKTMLQNIDVVGTVEDFAKFYGVSEQNVRSVINRYSTDKPKRRVFYKFHEFVKIIPKKWLARK